MVLENGYKKGGTLRSALGFLLSGKNAYNNRSGRATTQHMHISFNPRHPMLLVVTPIAPLSYNINPI
jgi:hypothetical protein